METVFVKKEEPCDIEDVFIKEEPPDEPTNLFYTNETAIVQIKIEEKCLPLDVNDSTVKKYDDCATKNNELKDHKLPKVFPCKYCSKIYKTEYGRSGHEKIHTKGIPVCKICNKTYATHSNLYQHLKMHTTTRFECDICKMQFSYKQTLKKHIVMKHIGERVPRVPCGICKKYFYKYHLRRHLTNVHLNDNQLECQMCDKNFSKTIDLKKHLLQIEFHKLVQQGAGYTLDYFHYEQTHQSEYKKRTRINKEVNNSIKFTELLHEYPQSNIIVKEELIIDDDLMTQNDSNCNSIEMSETPAKSSELYRCDICNKGYSRKDRLKVHLEVHVYGPYVCDICNKVFPMKFLLKKHLNSHVYGANKCNNCHATFVKKESLKTHIKKCHNGKVRKSQRVKMVPTVVAKAEQLLQEMKAARMRRNRCQVKKESFKEEAEFN